MVNIIGNSWEMNVDVERENILLWKSISTDYIEILDNMSPQIDQIKSSEEILEQSIPNDRSEEICNVQKYLLILLFIQWVISLHQNSLHLTRSCII